MPPPPDVDCVIIGGGPAGLAVARTLMAGGISVRVFERGPIAHHIAQYPTFMRFFSTNSNLEVDGFPLAAADDKPTRREYLQYLVHFARHHRLPVETYAEVTGVEPLGGHAGFRVHVARPGGRFFTCTARAVVAAVGAWEFPRRLMCPGAGLAKVHTRMEEPHAYIGKRVLVVGGRNSAVEAALTLHRAGADVALSYRGTEFNGVGLKYWLRPDIENRLRLGEIRPLLGTDVTRVDWETVEVTSRAGGRREVIPNDFVLSCLGYDPPVAFLQRLGIRLEADTHRPEHNPATLESNVPGLFVAGVITAGNISGHVFIENSRHHGELILPRLRELCRG